MDYMERTPEMTQVCQYLILGLFCLRTRSLLTWIHNPEILDKTQWIPFLGLFCLCIRSHLTWCMPQKYWIKRNEFQHVDHTFTTQKVCVDLFCLCIRSLLSLEKVSSKSLSRLESNSCIWRWISGCRVGCLLDFGGGESCVCVYKKGEKEIRTASSRHATVSSF